jgi:flagellar assembly protein FliH
LFRVIKSNGSDIEIKDTLRLPVPRCGEDGEAPSYPTPPSPMSLERRRKMGASDSPVMELDRAGGIDRATPDLGSETVCTQSELKCCDQVEDAILEVARKQAERLLDEAREKVALAEKDAREKGFAAGFRDGAAKCLEASEESLNEAKEVLDKARDQARRMIDQSKEGLVDLAISVASRIIRDEISLKPNTVMRLLDEAMERVDGQGVRTIRANPRDAVVLEENLPSLCDRWPGLADTVVMPERSIEPGGFVMESDIGILDCSIDSQLGRLRASLIEAFESLGDEAGTSTREGGEQQEI